MSRLMNKKIPGTYINRGIVPGSFGLKKVHFTDFVICAND
jgi:hypothetical protein